MNSAASSASSEAALRMRRQLVSCHVSYLFFFFASLMKSNCSRDEFGCFVGVIGGGVENEATTRLVPFLVLVLLFCLLDEIQLLAVETILVLGFFVGASDSGGEGSENVGSAGRESCWCGRGGGVICLVWRRRPKAASSPSSGSTEKRVLGIIAW